MKAITIPTPGDADALVLTEVPTPQIAADEVLVLVAAAGVNRADLMPALMRTEGRQWAKRGAISPKPRITVHTHPCHRS